MIKVGDRVSFLNSTGNGIVLSIKNKNIAIVETDDGFEIPHPISELVLSKTQQFRIRESEVEVSKNLRSDKILIYIMPENTDIEVNESYNFWIINDSECYFSGVVSRDHKGLRKYLSHISSEPLSKSFLFSINKRDLKFVHFLFINGICYTKEIFDSNIGIEESYNLRRYDFDSDSQFQKNVFFPKDSLELIVRDFNISETSSLVDITKKVNQIEGDIAINSKPKNYRTEKEVDLHIEELLENHSKMSKKEILEYQIYTIRKEIDDAIVNRLKKVIFIHGIGNGRLKQELISVVAEYKRVKNQDASYQKYGFGATEVLIC